NFRSDITANITDHFTMELNLSGNQRHLKRWYWPYDGSQSQTVSDFYRSTFKFSVLYPFYVDSLGNPTNNPNDIPVRPGASGYDAAQVVLNNPGYRDVQYRTLSGILQFDLDLGEYIKGLGTRFMASYVQDN